MAATSKPQKDTVERVMHEFKHHELETAGGRKVRNPKQAIAIALHEAGASKYESKQKNAWNLRRTKSKERQGDTARDEAERRPAGETRTALYEEAKRRNIPGRSRMSKEELQQALDR